MSQSKLKITFCPHIRTIIWVIQDFILLFSRYWKNVAISFFHLRIRERFYDNKKTLNLQRIFIAICLT